MATLQRLDCRQLAPEIGAVVDGVDLAGPLHPQHAEELRCALWTHGVLFFRDQDIGATQLEAFAARFGQVMAEPFVLAPQDKVTEGNSLATKHATAIWHADTTHAAEPPRLTVLRMVKTPPSGGDTCWASMHAAYDALSAPLRAMLDGLTAIHSAVPTIVRFGSLAGLASFPPGTVENVHPVVCAHPETGRKALYVNEAWTTRIVELEPRESAHLLAMLFEHVKTPDFFIRWRWTPKDVAIWDNRAVQHYAVPDYDGERVMQRAVVAGERPRGPG